MLKDIHTKLSDCLVFESFNERDVAYSLIQMRKILEKEDIKKEFPLIVFYADWVVHSFLDKYGAQQELAEIEKIFTGNRETDAQVDIINAVYPLISFTKLKGEMEKFLEKYLLPKQVLVEPFWNNFLDCLIEILSDIPLKAKVENSLVKEFVFRPQTTNQDVIFEIMLSNGLNFTQVTNFTHLKNFDN